MPEGCNESEPIQGPCPDCPTAAAFLIARETVNAHDHSSSERTLNGLDLTEEIHSKVVARVDCPGWQIAQSTGQLVCPLDYVTNYARTLGASTWPQSYAVNLDKPRKAITEPQTGNGHDGRYL
jgi:hypothetical protein